MITFGDVKRAWRNSVKGYEAKEGNLKNCNGEPRLNPNIGDSVRIIYTGGYHSNFSSLQSKLGFDDYHERKPQDSKDIYWLVGEVVSKALHPEEDGIILYGIQCSNGYQLIMSNSVSRECFKIEGRKNNLPEDLFHV